MLSLHAYSADEVDEGGIPVYNSIQGNELEEPIFFTLPKDAGDELTCSKYDDDAQQWQALDCPEESFAETSATCCSRSFGTFGLISTELIEVAAGTAPDLHDVIPPFTPSYLIAAIVAMTTMVISFMCMCWQIKKCRDERK